MSEDVVETELDETTETDGKKKKPKAPKAPKVPKRPSDYEIVRTILQRTTERKQAYLLKNLGEDADILFMCSCDEEGFTYGSPELSIAILEITDPELRTIVDTHMSKLYGLRTFPEITGFVCLRDQISELGKTKGEGIEGEVFTNFHGSAWVMKEDNKGRMKPSYYSKAINSLYHVQLVASYCRSFRPLLEGEDSRYLYYPYSHTETDTASILHLPPQDLPHHPVAPYYPHGFRARVTKGLDVIIGKGMTEPFPYAIQKEEMIIFNESGQAVQLVHRVTANGWRMVVVRPNLVLFPAHRIPLPQTGLHQL